MVHIIGSSDLREARTISGFANPECYSIPFLLPVQRVNVGRVFEANKKD